jgi:hypothetical protein
LNHAGTDPELAVVRGERHCSALQFQVLLAGIVASIRRVGNQRKGMLVLMAPVQDPTKPTRIPQRELTRVHNTPQVTWSTVGQTIVSAAGGAAIVGLAAGPEGAAVAAVVGGIIGFVLAVHNAREVQRHNEH